MSLVYALPCQIVFRQTLPWTLRWTRRDFPDRFRPVSVERFVNIRFPDVFIDLFSTFCANTSFTVRVPDGSPRARSPKILIVTNAAPNGPKTKKKHGATSRSCLGISKPFIRRKSSLSQWKCHVKMSVRFARRPDKKKKPSGFTGYCRVSFWPKFEFELTLTSYTSHSVMCWNADSGNSLAISITDTCRAGSVKIANFWNARKIENLAGSYVCPERFIFHVSDYKRIDFTVV